MATKKAEKDKKVSRKVKYVMIHKFAAGISLLSLFVVMIAGIMAETSVFTMAFRSLLVIVVIALISRIVTQILATYEEMNTGEA